MLKPIEIFVGLIFKPSGFDHLDVITNTGKDNWFEATRCLNPNLDSFQVTAGAGSATRSDIEEIISSVDPEILKKSLVEAWQVRLKQTELSSDFIKEIDLALSSVRRVLS